MTNSKQKGARGEREARDFFNSYGYNTIRGVQYQGGPDSPDVKGLPGIHVEVKRTNSLRLYPALEQSHNDASNTEIPIVMHRPDKRPWVIIMDAKDFMTLYGAYYDTIENIDT